MAELGDFFSLKIMFIFKPSNVVGLCWSYVNSRKNWQFLTLSEAAETQFSTDFLYYHRHRNDRTSLINSKLPWASESKVRLRSLPYNGCLLPASLWFCSAPTCLQVIPFFNWLVVNIVQHTHHSLRSQRTLTSNDDKTSNSISNISI